MAEISKEEMLKRIIALAQRQGLNRQKGGTSGRRTRNLLSGDIDPRLLGLGLGSQKPAPQAEAIPEDIPDAEIIEDTPEPADVARETDPSSGTGPTTPDMPDLNPIQARMGKDYMNPEIASLGKKIAGKGVLAAGAGSYYGAGLSGVVPAMMNPTYGAGYGLYKTIDAATDAQHKGKQLEDVFSEQGFGFGDTYVQDQITMAQDFDKTSKESYENKDNVDIVTPPEHLDPGVLEAIQRDPTWMDKFGLSKRARGRGADESNFDITDTPEVGSTHAPGGPGYEEASIGIENEMAAIEVGVDVFGDRESNRRSAADVDASEMSALGMDAAGVADFDATYGGYNEDGSWNFGGKEEGPGAAPGTDPNSLDSDFEGMSDDIGGGDGDAK